jgi:hypothetical protein
MDLKGLEREVIVAYGIYVERLKKTMKNLRILDVLAKSQTKHLPV